MDYSPARKWLSFELVGKMYVRTSFLLKYVGSVAPKGCAWQDSHENSFCGTHIHTLIIIPMRAFHYDLQKKYNKMSYNKQENKIW